MSTRSDTLEFKSATLYALRLVLHTADTPELLQALDACITEANGFYDDEPVILDARELTQAPDWKKLLTAVRKHQLHPIGVQAEAPLLASALKAGLSPLDSTAGRTQDKPPATATATAPTTSKVAASPDGAPAAPATTVAATTLVIRHPLRSGQRIYARGGDLIVMGQVSQGAEVIADGHIHVYGPLRGKAMAGAQGRTDAMIMTTELDPELLAIAGIYRVVETKLPSSLHKQAAQVVLEGDTLRIRAL